MNNKYYILNKSIKHYQSFIQEVLMHLGDEYLALCHKDKENPDQEAWDKFHNISMSAHKNLSSFASDLYIMENMILDKQLRDRHE